MNHNIRSIGSMINEVAQPASGAIREEPALSIPRCTIPRHTIRAATGRLKQRMCQPTGYQTTVDVGGDRGRRVSGIRFASLMVVVGACCTGGCFGPSRTNVLTITDRGTAGQDKQYHEAFDEAYYDIDGVGNVDLILRRARPAQENRDQGLRQTVHVRSVWNSIPGRTIASATQINGRIRYVIHTDAAHAAFEGAGSVFYRRKKEWGRELLVGRVERTHLRAVPHSASGPAIFERVELGGEFRAVHDDRRVRQLINEMDRSSVKAGER